MQNLSSPTASMAGTRNQQPRARERAVATSGHSLIAFRIFGREIILRHDVVAADLSASSEQDRERF
jgi:hypothetical protein